VTTTTGTSTHHLLIYANNQLKLPSVTDFEDALRRYAALQQVHAPTTVHRHATGAA